MPKPKVPQFDDPNFISELKNLFNDGNTFLNNYGEQQLNSGKTFTNQDAFDMVDKFLESYRQPGVKNEQLDAICALMLNYRSMRNSLNQYKANGLDADVFAQNARTQYIAIMQSEPSFSELVNSFISGLTKKGVSLGNDGLRMLSSFAQNMNDITDRCNMQNDIVHLEEHYKGVITLASESKEIDKQISQYSKNCHDNNILGVNIDLDLYQWNTYKNGYEKRLEENNAKIEQHTNEYNECSRRITDNKEQLYALDKQRHEQIARRNELFDLHDRLGLMADEVNSMIEDARDLDDEVKSYELNLEQINKQIALGEGNANLRKEKENFLDNLPEEFKNDIATAQQLSIENDIIIQSANAMLMFNNDISDSYRYAMANGGDMIGINADKQSAIQFYINNKNRMLEIEPSLKEKFDAFENNPANRIPADFDKCFGQDIVDSLNRRSDEYNKITNSDMYKEYVKTSKELDQINASENVLAGLKEEKARIELDLSIAKDKRSDAIERVSNWSKIFKDALGDKFPENPTIENIGQALNKEILGAISELSILNDTKKQFEDAIKTDVAKMDSLKEGTTALKKAGLENKIQECDNHIENANKFKADKEKIGKNMRHYAKGVAFLCDDSKTTLSAPYDRVKERLSNIYNHFDDVTSFWSKGKSPECKKMYDGIKNVIDKLGDKDATITDILSEINKAKNNTKGYLEAKHSQIRAKSLSSEQRHWRLSKSEEAFGILENAEKMFTTLYKDSKAPKVEMFINDSKKLLAQGPEAALQSRIEKSFKQYVPENIKKDVQKTEIKEAAKKQGSVNLGAL